MTNIFFFSHLTGKLGNVQDILASTSDVQLTKMSEFCLQMQYWTYKSSIKFRCKCSDWLSISPQG